MSHVKKIQMPKSVTNFQTNLTSVREGRVIMSMMDTFGNRASVFAYVLGKVTSGETLNFAERRLLKSIWTEIEGFINEKLEVSDE